MSMVERILSVPEKHVVNIFGQFDEFVREENRSESKSIDELTTYTYGQKVTENG